MKSFFHRLSLSQQFLLVSFPILLAGTVATGWWVGRQVEDSVVHRIGAVTALYVDSFVAPHVQTMVSMQDLTTADHEMLHNDLVGTPLGKKIVSLKIWRKDGYVLFSTDAQAIGKTFPIDAGLQQALDGRIFSEISERSDAQQSEHGQPLPRLIETYTPIHADRTGEVIAAAEFYERPDEVDRDAGAAQRRSWLLVAVTMLAMYLLLFLVVRRGSRTIDRQSDDLRDKLQQLTTLNAQNVQLQERVIRAAERATAFNENFLQRVSADLHDGPVQDLGFALMQIKNIRDAVDGPGADANSDWPRTLQQSANALESAMADLRAVSSDLELPELSTLGPADVAARVVRDFQTKTGASVHFISRIGRLDASFRSKVALYRLLQESLANAFRHAGGQGCQVVIDSKDSQLSVEISDTGPGFDVAAVASRGRLGLHGMRQRVEVLGGAFDIQSTPGNGTRIRVTLPLEAQIETHAWEPA